MTYVDQHSLSKKYFNTKQAEAYGPSVFSQFLAILDNIGILYNYKLEFKLSLPYPFVKITYRNEIKCLHTHANIRMI